MFWFRKEVESVARKHGLDADVVQAICLVESSGVTSAFRYEPGFWQRYLVGKPEWMHANPMRVSSSYGLMQCMFPVACELGYAGPPEQLFVPEIGLEWGCRKLASLLKWSGGNLDQALAAYNGGQKGNATPPYRNQGYVNKVRTQLREIRE